MLHPRAAWTTVPPAPRDRMQNQPTLLFSWWCTSFSAAIILTRICGRKIRSNKLFREDWIMLIALFPLFARMVFIHFVLIYRTNNVDTVGYDFTATDLYFREIGSRLVLPGRIFYAMFIWFCKLTVSEFLKRITIRIWRRSYELTLRGIRIFLLITFGAVVLATLTECHPFDHYWQVVPDPGPHCRLGYAHLFTMGICDMVTDLLLILFPIPIVLMSGQTWKRKLQLASLFSLSIVMIAITATRMAMVVGHGGLQQYRTVWASCEILASASTANAVVLGSFVRDKGTKRNRYVSYSVSDSINRVPTRRPTLASCGSEEDLFHSMGCRLPDHLQDTAPQPARPAPPAFPASALPPSQRISSMASIITNDPFYQVYKHEAVQGSVLAQVLPSPSVSTDRSGSVMDTSPVVEGDHGSKEEVSAGHIRWPLKVDSSDSSVVAHDFAPLIPAQSRRSTRTSLPDSTAPGIPLRRASVVRHPFTFFQARSISQSGPASPPAGVQGPILERHDAEQPLRDAGGLLNTASGSLPAAHPLSPWREPNGELGRSISNRAIRASVEGQMPNLEDVGNLFSADHIPDAAVIAMERVVAGHHDPEATCPPVARR